ncbi:uncharacterized protein METZ01_LOCUS164496, partial [marine metagenome]
MLIDIENQDLKHCFQKDWIKFLQLSGHSKNYPTKQTMFM